MSVSEQLSIYPSPNPTLTLLSIDCFWVKGGDWSITAQIVVPESIVCLVNTFISSKAKKPERSHLTF